MKHFVNARMTALALFALFAMLFTACGGEESGPTEPNTPPVENPDEKPDEQIGERTFEMVAVKFTVTGMADLDPRDLYARILRDGEQVTMVTIDEPVELEPGVYTVELIGALIETTQIEVMIDDESPDTEISVEVKPKDTNIENPDERVPNVCSNVGWVITEHNTHWECHGYPCTLELEDFEGDCTVRCYDDHDDWMYEFIDDVTLTRSPARITYHEGEKYCSPL